MAMKDCPNTSQESTGCMCPFEPFLQRYCHMPRITLETKRPINKH
uniref:Uncharacterized protein n=1 Tax=Rhizophora mucronata TaxID=61149 RepID=A0A2P2KSX8_RHIMU